MTNSLDNILNCKNTEGNNTPGGCRHFILTYALCRQFFKGRQDAIEKNLYLYFMKYKFILPLLCLWQCTVEENKKPVEYSGPLREINGMVMHYAELNKVKIKMTAAKVKEYISGDREFPEGIHIEFYDAMGLKSSDLRANSAYYFKKENQWRGRGKVVIQNINKGEELSSEELFWKPDTRKIFTEKFVTIKEPEQVLYGTGLDANLDENGELKDYIIKNPGGEFDVKE